MFRILVVDDEPSVLKMLKTMLESDDYEILEASNGVEARAICETSEIHLIITDIVMPEKNGIDLIMEVKKNFPAITIIAISGGGGIDGRFDYLDIAALVGAKNILRKPFSVTELRDMTDSALQRKEVVTSI